MYRFGVVALVAAAAAGCTSARTAAAAATGTDPKVIQISSIQTNELDRIICRRVREVGTHLYRKQCRSQRQINEQMQQTQDEVLLGLYKIQGAP